MATNEWGTAFSNITHIEIAMIGFFEVMPPMPVPAIEGRHLVVPCMGQAPSIPSPLYSWVSTPGVNGSSTETMLVLDDRIQKDANGTEFFILVGPIVAFSK